MAEVDEYDSQISSELDKYEREIKALSKKDFGQKQTAISRIDKIKKQINTLIESYEIEINQLEKSKALQYKEPLRQINKRFQDLNYEFEATKSATSGQEKLFDNRTNLNPNQMSTAQVIELGEKTQQAGLLSLENTFNKVNQGIALGDEMIVELDKQIEQLGNMEKTVKDTRSVLNRSQKYIKYFARQIYTDKLLMTLICLIAIVVVAIIICSVCGYDLKKMKDSI